MQLPRLTPLQSRLLASVIATVLLVGVWLSFRPANFVYAAEIASAPQDAGHALFGQAIPLEEEHGGDLAGREAESSDTRGGYLGDFAYFDESLVGRADEPVGELVLDQMSETDLTPRNTKNFVVMKAQFSVKRGEDGDDELESVDQRGGNNASKRRTDADSAHLEEDEGEEQMVGIQKRQSQKTLYFSVTTCRQPMPMMHTTDDPLQLTLYISNDTRNQKPGPKSKDHLATPPISLVDGYAKFALNSTSDVYLGIDAPGLEKDWNGSYHFQIAASTVDFYHKVDNEHSFAYKVDTDSGAALFITHNFTDNSASVEKWKTVQGENIPFRMYAFENATWGARGLTRSLCGLQNAFQSGNSSININTTMIAQYGEPLPKAQFHVQGLKANTTYTGMVAIAGNMPLDGLDFGEMKVPKGGQVWTQFNWTTKDGTLSSTLPSTHLHLPPPPQPRTN
jgi:calcium channel MID1